MLNLSFFLIYYNNVFSLSFWLKRPTEDIYLQVKNVAQFKVNL